MASVDGGKSLLGASDETHEHVCDPCKTEEIEREARHYCVECQEYLCENCKLSHQKFKLSKNHDVLSGSNMPKHVLISQRPSFTVDCSCNQNREVEVYCEDHVEVICNYCKALSHRKCKLSNLRDKATNYTSEKLQSVVDKTKTLKDKMDQLHKEKKASVSRLESLKGECRKEIMLFREELNIYLDKMEQSMLKDLDTFQKKQTVVMDEDVTSLTAALERLGLDLKMLEHAKQADRKETMFASEMKVSKSLNEYENLLGDMQKRDTKPALVFERNKKLTDILRSLDTLGSIKGNMMVATYHEGRSPIELKDLKIRSSFQVTVASPSDRGNSWISGCCFMPNGDIVICDFKNERLTLLDQNFSLKDKIDVKGGLYSVSAVDENNVIVTLSWKQQIQYIQVFPTLKCSRVIQLDKDCYGIYATGGKLYVSFETGDKGEVRVLDLNGTLEKKIDVSQDGTYLFRCPYNITASETGKEIFVADCRTDAVTCMSDDGQIIYQCKDAMVKRPRGVHVDAENNAYVCCSDTNNVGVITADGRFCRSVVSASEGIQSPRSIAFRDTDRTLIVGCYEKTNLHCFKQA